MVYLLVLCLRFQSILQINYDQGNGATGGSIRFPSKSIIGIGGVISVYFKSEFLLPFIVQDEDLGSKVLNLLESQKSKLPEDGELIEAESMSPEI